jgi:hypothetical protein
MHNKLLFKFGNTNNASELHTAFFINFSNFNLCKSYAVLAMTGFSASIFSLLGLCTLPASAILHHTLLSMITRSQTPQFREQSWMQDLGTEECNSEN